MVTRFAQNSEQMVQIAAQPLHDIHIFICNAIRSEHE